MNTYKFYIDADEKYLTMVTKEKGGSQPRTIYNVSLDELREIAQVAVLSQDEFEFVKKIK